MDHKTSSLDVISIFGGSDYERHFLNAVCNAKEHSSEIIPSDLPDGPLTILNRNFKVTGLHTCLLYLDEKFPSPALIVGDPETRAAILMLIDLINSGQTTPTKDYTEVLAFTSQAKPYLLGERITLPDVALIPIQDQLPVSNYTDLIAEIKEPCNRSSSDSSSSSSSD